MDNVIKAAIITAIAIIIAALLQLLQRDKKGAEETHAVRQRPILGEDKKQKINRRPDLEKKNKLYEKVKKAFLYMVTKLPIFFKNIFKFPQLPIKARKIFLYTVVGVAIFSILFLYLLNNECLFKKPTTDLASLDSKVTFINTINFPWAHISSNSTYGHDFGKVDMWSHHGVSNNSEVRKQFKLLNSLGVKQIVWHLFADGRASPEFDSTGMVLGLDNYFYNDIDSALSLAKEFKINLVFVLIDFKWFKAKEIEDGATKYGRYETIIDSRKRESFHSEALVPFLKNYSCQPQISGWIIINEPENALKEGFVSYSDLRIFVKETAELIHKHTHHQRVTVGSSDLISLIKHFSDPALGLDYLNFHQMGEYKNIIPISIDFLRRTQIIPKELPIYIGEFQFDNTILKVNDYLKWSWRLGYSGAWPWSLNDVRSYDFAVKNLKNARAFYDSLLPNLQKEMNWFEQDIAKLSSEEIKEYNSELISWANIVEQSRSTTKRLLEKFRSELQIAIKQLQTNSLQIVEKESLIKEQIEDLSEQENYLAKAISDSTENKRVSDEKQATMMKADSLINKWQEEIEAFSKQALDDSLNWLEPAKKILQKVSSQTERELYRQKIREARNSIAEKNRLIFDRQGLIEEKNVELNNYRVGYNDYQARFRDSVNWKREKEKEIKRIKELITSLQREKKYAEFSLAKTQRWGEWLRLQIEFVNDFYDTFLGEQKNWIDNQVKLFTSNI